MNRLLIPANTVYGETHTVLPEDIFKLQRDDFASELQYYSIKSVLGVIRAAETSSEDLIGVERSYAQKQIARHPR